MFTRGPEVRAAADPGSPFFKDRLDACGRMRAPAGRTFASPIPLTRGLAVGQDVRLISVMYNQRLHGHADGVVEKIEPLAEPADNGERHVRDPDTPVDEDGRAAYRPFTGERRPRTEVERAADSA